MIVISTKRGGITLHSVCVYAVCLPVHACKPSNHVCSTPPLLPQRLCQAPPGAQQLRLPDFLLIIPHFKHVRPIVVTAVAGASGVGIEVLSQRSKEIDRPVSFGMQGSIFHQARAYRCRPASLQSMCAQRLRCRHFFHIS